MSWIISWLQSGTLKSVSWFSGELMLFSSKCNIKPQLSFFTTSFLGFKNTRYNCWYLLEAVPVTWVKVQCPH